jgi:raffinose/stachyose/melibiose transport system substrate-binding protein
MKMSKKSLAAILAAAMMTTAFASCGSNESGNTSGNASGDADAPYTFKVISENSADDPTSDVHPVKLALDDYIKDHPNFSYEFETVKKYDIASKIAILISSNDVPDMFTYEDGTSLDALIERDAIVDIDEDFSRIGVELEDVVLPGAINSKHVLSNHEHIYSLPMQLTTNGVWYNKQMFEEKGWSVPASWQEFQQLCADIKEAGVQPLACNGSDKWPITRWIMLYADRMEGESVHLDASQNKNNRSFRDDIFVEAATEAQKMFQNGYFGEGFNTVEASTQYQMFLTGQAAMMYSGSWLLATWTDPEVNTLGEENIGYFIPPGIEGSSIDMEHASQMDDLSCATALCLGKEKFETGKTHDFLKYLFTTIGDRQSEIGIMTPYVTTKDLDYSPTQQLIVDQLQKSQYPTLWFEAKMDSATTDIALENAQLLAEGSMTPQEYCDRLADSVDEAFPAE